MLSTTLIASLAPVLVDRHHVHRTLGSGVEAPNSFNVTPYGLDLHAQGYVEGYDAMLTQVLVELVNGELRTDRQFAADRSSSDARRMSWLGSCMTSGFRDAWTSLTRKGSEVRIL